MDAAELARRVAAAAERLQGHVLQTPLVACPWMSEELGADVRWKLENVQHTGSFKLRGATHALLGLSPAERERGVVAASSGNHGLGLAAACGRLGVAAEVFVPSTTPADKRAAIERYGAAVAVHGDDCVVTEGHARAYAAARDQVYVSPYNDVEVVAGQGSVMVELLDQWPDVDAVYVAVGGGGLISGMAALGKARRPEIEFVGCSPLASPAMAECVRRGELVDVPCGETWSDSTAGGVEAGAVTFPWCQELVDRFVDVPEDAVERGMRDALSKQHLLVEGAVGVALAACREDRARRGDRVAVIVCGGNLPYDLLQRLVRGG
ncbi:MAG: pyridoxal-phosphate dependent enzyme [Planctomycetota bacterium]